MLHDLPDLMETVTLAAQLAQEGLIPDGTLFQIGLRQQDLVSMGGEEIDDPLQRMLYHR